MPEIKQYTVMKQDGKFRCVKQISDQKEETEDRSVFPIPSISAAVADLLEFFGASIDDVPPEE